MKRIFFVGLLILSCSCVPAQKGIKLPTDVNFIGYVDAMMQVGKTIDYENGIYVPWDTPHGLFEWDGNSRNPSITFIRNGHNFPTIHINEIYPVEYPKNATIIIAEERMEIINKQRFAAWYYDLRRGKLQDTYPAELIYLHCKKGKRYEQYFIVKMLNIDKEFIFSVATHYGGLYKTLVNK